MKKVMIEFPVIGYAEVMIEVADDATSEDILYAIEVGDIDVPYDGHSHAEALTPLMNIIDYRNSDGYIPFQIQVVD